MIPRTPRSTLFPYTTLFRSSETDEKKECSVFYIMERTGGNRSRLTMELYLKKNWLLKTMFSLTMKNKMEGSFRRSLVRLEDRKSTRLNSSHSQISYAVFCLK